MKAHTFKSNGRIIREVTIEARDLSLGMTAGEMMDALIQIPATIVPTVEIRLSGRVKRIKFRIQIVPD